MHDKILFDDDAINACRKSDQPSDCQFCPARARCGELVRAEFARELGPEPPEEVGRVVHSHIIEGSQADEEDAIAKGIFRRHPPYWELPEEMEE